ncbi:septal ring lytic transglycosylase RlpA family protein [Micromonospora fluostatini]|uniref:septal ring lytic transglycosylase RlpA family protein n=1 Tax=Micromonospora sp. JCM 30529 TaxID=3421643 RepID=UPI003D178976
MTDSPLRTRIFSSPAGVAATAVVGVALAVGGTVGTVRLTAGATGSTPPPAVVDPLPTTAVPGPPAASPSVTTSPSPTASPTAQPSPSRTEAASRSRPRTAAPKPTTAKPAATPTTAKPSPAKKPAPTVVDSGSCGASFYASGQVTANGEAFDPNELTAAHKTLPFDTRVRVTNPDTGASVTVRINDRGPFIAGRCLDLSRAAFAVIAPLEIGALTVRYDVLG